MCRKTICSRVHNINCSLKKYHVYIILLTSVLTVIMTITAEGTGLWYDEIIVTEISKLSLIDLIDTVKAEPHPPGFYLLLKALHINNTEILRVSTTLLSFSLMAVVTLYGTITGVFRRYRLKYGLVLFLSSPFWFMMSTNIKQEAVTTPLLVFALMVFLNYKENKTTINYLLLFCISLTTLFFGYISFVKVTLVLLYGGYLKSRKALAVATGSIALVLVIYLRFFGLEQLTNNAGRFTWQADQYRQPIDVLYTAVGGSVGSGKSIFSGDLYIIIGAVMLVMYATVSRQPGEVGFLKLMMFGTFTYFYIVGVARDRYIGEVVVLFFVVVGWQLQSILKDSRKKPIVYLLLLLYFINGLLNFYMFNSACIRYRRQNLLINDMVGNKYTGIIDRHPLEPYIRKVAYFPKNNSAIPLSLYTPLYNKRVANIDREFLLYDGFYEGRNIAKTLEGLKNTGLNRFIYIVSDDTTWGNFQNYYDPNQITLKALNYYCQDKDLEFLHRKFIVIFENCDYRKMPTSSIE